MFRLPPSRPIRSGDDELTGAGRPLRNALVARTHREEARLCLNDPPGRGPRGPVPPRADPVRARRQPAGTAVDPSTPTTHLDPP